MSIKVKRKSMASDGENDNLDGRKIKKLKNVKNELSKDADDKIIQSKRTKTLLKNNFGNSDKKNMKNVGAKQELQGENVNNKIKSLKRKNDVNGDIGFVDKIGKKPRFTKKTKQDLKSKPNWLEFKKAKKELKKTRREQRNPLYELTLQAKKIWEEVRNHNCHKEKRLKLIDQLHSILKGKLSSVVHSHDMARVVQCMLKFGSTEIRYKISEELLPHTIPIMLSKYGCYCIKKLLVYSNNNYRKKFIDEMVGSVVKLLNHSIASRWLEYAYITWASQPQKLAMRQELYGNLFKLSKDDSISNLSDLFAKNLQVKPAVLSTTKALLTKAMEKKHIMVSSLLHTVLLDYITHCDEAEKNEVFESLIESILQLLTSRDGTIVAMNIVWHGTTKVKKAIVKMLKGHIKEISELEHGHLLLLAVFDSVDDTVLVKKVLFTELLSVAEEMAVDEIGRRVLLHLTVHRDRQYFHPFEIELLQRGDKIGTSKKDAALKHKELLDGVLNPLLTFVSGNPSHWLSNPSVSMLTLGILKTASNTDTVDSDKLKDAQTAIASFLVNNDNSDIIEDAGLHFVIKKLIKNDTNIVKVENGLKLSTFSSALLCLLTESVIQNWVKTNRGCFLLVCMLETGDGTSVTELKKRISRKNIKSTLKDETTIGAKILLKKIKEM